MLILETGAGLTNSNSYSSVDEADLYHEARLHTSIWDDADDDDKEAALQWATRLIDEKIDFAGYKTSSTQALEFPRSGLYDRGGNSIGSGTVPTWLKNATAEYARYLIGEDLELSSGLSGFKELVVGPIEIVVDKADRKTAMPASVWSMLKFYGSTSTSSIRRLYRV